MAKTKQDWLDAQINKLTSSFNQRTVASARVLAMEMVKKNNLGDDLDIWTFGACAGFSQVWLEQLARKLDIRYNKFHVLDSWIGLPEEKENIEKEASWLKGNYSTKDEFCCETVEDAVELSRQFFRQFNFYPNLIQGFYEDSLPKIDLSKIKPAKMLDVDVDLMISTETLLEWMTQSSLLIPGTVIHYDDFLSIDRTKGGEGMAHDNWVKKYNVRGNFKEYYGGIIFEILNI